MPDKTNNHNSFCKQLIDSFESRLDRVSMRIVGDESQVFTFGESLNSIRSVAYRMGRENVGFGDRVALIGENHPCWAIAYLATLYHGAVCVPLDPHGEIETITNFIENSEAKLAFIGSEVKEKFGQIEERLGRHIPTVVWGNGGAPTDSTTRADFASWASTQFPDDFAREIPNANGDDVALLIYTSGTTGTPKGVPLTHGNIVAELSGVNDVLKLTDKETILSLLPLFHAYLQIVNLWVATTYGIEVGYLKELSPAELGTAMKEFKPTILTTVPRLWYLFHKKIFDAVEAKPKAVQLVFRGMLALNGTLRDTVGINLGRRFFGQVHESFGGRLRLAVSAGSRFDNDVALDFHKLGFTILQGYGLTETSGAATATHEKDNRVGSVGTPMKGAEIKINEPDKEGVGEVLIRGPIVFKGYYKNPTATAEAFTDDGWFKSGDLGQIDKDGHLYIVGRAKDVIVLPSGKNVHPEDLEVHYLKTPYIEEMAIIGIADTSEQRAGAEKLVAIVVPDFEYLRQAKVANSKEVVRYTLDDLGRELPEYQRVREYIIRAEPLPRTATRKIKRFQLKKEIESGKLGGDAPETKSWTHTDDDKALLATHSAKTVVAAIRQNAKDADTIHPDMNLEIDLGLDSLARAETFAALEQAFGIEADGDEAAKALTVRDVIAFAERHGGKQDAPVSTELNWSNIIKQADDDFPEIRSVLRSRPFFAGFAFAVYSIWNVFCQVFMRLEMQNVENLHMMIKPENSNRLQPFIIAPNHQSYLDPFVLCSNYPFILFRNIFHVGASMFFESRLMRWVATMLNVVPVDPDTQLMRAMKAGAVGLKHGKVLNIYPEGERAYDGELHQFKKGAAILATELDVPILPVAIDGLHKVWARRSWRIRPGKVKIRFGEAFYPREILDARPDSLTSPESQYTAVTEHLRHTIASMITEMRRESIKDRED